MPLIISRPYRTPSLPPGVSDLGKTLSQVSDLNAAGDPRYVWWESKDNPLNETQVSLLNAAGDPRYVWWESKDNPLDVVQASTMNASGT